MSQKGKYAVREGRNPGVYDTYDEVKEQTDGYPRNIHKGGFETQEEAEKFVRGESSGGTSDDHYALRGGNLEGTTKDYGRAAEETYGVSGAEMKKFGSRDDALDFARGGK